MKRFVALYEALDSTTSTLGKVEALQGYFTAAPPADAAWALYFLSGRRLKRFLPTKLLVRWALELAGFDEWMFEECYGVVGDFAETVALLLPGSARPTEDELPLSAWMETQILPLRELPGEAQRERVQGFWRTLPRRELFILNKILTGEYRVGVSTTLVVKALALATQLEVATVAQRVMGDWTPSAEFFEKLRAPEGDSQSASAPYPFFLASPLKDPVESLGPLADWLVEWKWDGIRGQLLRREGQLFLWSRGEELLTARFPELHLLGEGLPDGTVLDGEVLAYENGQPLPFARLQTRIGRQKLTAGVLAKSPVVFMAFDLLEEDGVDLRELPLSERRQRLEALLAPRALPFLLSPGVKEAGWSALAKLRESARDRTVEGLMLKRLSSPYRAGRKRGDWWKWKIDPFTVDAVLIYAQAGSGKRANLFTDYTFAVWEEGELVPFAKAYSGLSDAEIAEMDKWIRGHTLQRFGPVRAVEPVHVFELHFEGIAASPRHKSGVAVRFPRISRWRQDKPAAEADTLQSLRALISLRPN